MDAAIVTGKNGCVKMAPGKKKKGFSIVDYPYPILCVTFLSIFVFFTPAVFELLYIR